uniref:Uncharacterized protein n=1 Tax=Romanomermis culicivorax TaxID=13658 RepID=A0A915K303_ROMCU
MLDAGRSSSEHGGGLIRCGPKIEIGEHLGLKQGSVFQVNFLGFFRVKTNSSLDTLVYLRLSRDTFFKRSTITQQKILENRQQLSLKLAIKPAVLTQLVEVA